MNEVIIIYANNEWMAIEWKLISKLAPPFPQGKGVGLPISKGKGVAPPLLAIAGTNVFFVFVLNEMRK